VAGQRKALIVAGDVYEHEGLRNLLSPAADAEALRRVLGDRQIGEFTVQVAHNEPAHVISAQIEELLLDSRPDDVLLLHFSCHGLKSDSGELFFAARNTRPDRLGSTAISADFVQRCMRSSRSRSIVLLLDCCYGGAFAQGVSVRAGGDVNVLDSFPRERSGGRGRAVITASSAMEYAFEGNHLATDQHSQPSVFTTALVEGLVSGEADLDNDGWVSVDELYDYLFDKVREQNPHQTPSRHIELIGDLYLARNPRWPTRPQATASNPASGGEVQPAWRLRRPHAITLVGAALAALAAIAAYVLASSPSVPTPSIRTSVSSAFAPLAGNVFVTYHDGTDADAQVSGQVANAVSGEVAKLYTRQFPFTSPPTPVSSVSLRPSGTTARYTFQVTPTLATRYTVEVFRNSTAAVPLARSATSTIYVVMNQPGHNTSHCTGSECQSMETVTVQVPASALSTQISEHVYTYFAVNLGTRATPETLQLGAGSPDVTIPQHISASEYQFRLMFSYPINNATYEAAWRHCTKSMEAEDGIGLPGSGSYGCGSATIQESAVYIG
jgi:uncharacterized caspase-like protein